MSLDTTAFLVLILAAVPAVLFIMNLAVYRPIARCLGRQQESVSVLIPARNEERNIVATLQSVLANRGVSFEVIVLDDHSTDRTGELVSRIAHGDLRVRLRQAPALPAGWCGKQHACYTLARLARHSLMVFLDADVRLEQDALLRLIAFMKQSGADLASGIPHQQMRTFSERLLIPLIHFILLGFLPMHAMRRTRFPSMSAGCGQLFIVRREAYQRSGGHAQLRNSLHDGIKLPRVFRQAGFKTDLFDATDVATCRMYFTDFETWRGLGKNATEGLAAPATIGPMTLLLFGGQVAPFLLLTFAPLLSPWALGCAALSAVLSWVPRLIAVALFRQPVASALLHPLGVTALLAIQWYALGRAWIGKPAQWKGRSYPASTNIKPAEAT